MLSLSSDAPLTAIDLSLQRRLMTSGHLSWLSASSKPDLGGLPADDHASLDELASSEVRDCLIARLPDCLIA
eukprot:5817947-Prymnesium_polylepis.1